MRSSVLVSGSRAVLLLLLAGASFSAACGGGGFGPTSPSEDAGPGTGVVGEAGVGNDGSVSSAADAQGQTNDDAGLTGFDSSVPDAGSTTPPDAAANDAGTDDAGVTSQDASSSTPIDASAPVDAGDGGSCGTPGGSYTGSCSACSVFQGVLSCTCKNNSKTTTDTSIDLCSCPDVTTISNQNGILTCCNSPGGSYTSTCNECAVTDYVLGCTCKTNNGGVLSSFLSLCACQGSGQQISNTNGTLTCQ